MGFGTRFALIATLTACAGGDTPTGATDDTPTVEPELFVTDREVRIDEDTSADFTLAAELVNSDRTVFFEIVEPPASGTLVGSDASWTYTPDEHFNGTDEVVWRAFVREERSAVAVVSFVVEPVNDASVAEDLALVARSCQRSPMECPPARTERESTSGTVGALGLAPISRRTSRRCSSTRPGPAPPTPEPRSSSRIHVSPIDDASSV